jgi:dienelactone hydrolase
MRASTTSGVVAVIAVAVATACSGGSPSVDAPRVSTEIVSDETTQDIWVTAPDRAGSWPVVYAMHGIGGSGADMTALATRLARAGMVVFAPTYNTDWSTNAGYVQAGQDAECGYRFVRNVAAAEHGGDLGRPVTFVGWSMGATSVLMLGLSEHIDPSGKIVSCFSSVPRPDLIVAVSGCYYEYEGVPADIDTSGWGNKDVRLVLVAGAEDTTCHAWQTRRAVGDLRALGYDVDLVVLQGADHLAPVFHENVDGESVVATDDPAGDRLVRVIADAIASAGP